MPSERAPRTDEELLQAFYQGDDEAFDALHERHERRMAGLAHELFRKTWASDLPNLQEGIADAVQNTFLKVVRSRSRQATAGWNPGRTVKPWLNQILRNEVVNVLRKHGRQEEATGTESADGQTLLDTRVDDGRRDAVEDPTSHAEAADDIERLRALIDALPARQREVLLLKFWGGLSQNEIAGSLGTTGATVSREVSRALSTLHQRFYGDINGVSR